MDHFRGGRPFVFGCINAFDVTARQTFVHDLVGAFDLPNAVALNSSSMTAARMIGPAVAGVLIASIGTGSVFMINALSFVAVVLSLFLLNRAELFHYEEVPRPQVRLLDGFRFIFAKSELKLIFVMTFLLCTFGYNFPVYISTMSVSVFQADAKAYGVLLSMMAVGALIGALVAAERGRPTIGILTVSAGAFALSLLVAAMMPNYLMFGLMLIIVGASAQTFNTSANSLVQLSSRPDVRGRVMAVLLAISLGATPIGAPIAGLVAETIGPRWSLVIGAGAGVVATLVSIIYQCRPSDPTLKD